MSLLLLFTSSTQASSECASAVAWVEYPTVRSRTSLTPKTVLTRADVDYSWAYRQVRFWDGEKWVHDRVVTRPDAPDYALAYRQIRYWDGDKWVQEPVRPS